MKNINKDYELLENIPTKIASVVSCPSCGDGTPFFDGADEDYVPSDFIKNLKKPYIVKIHGDSMSPTLIKGDKLIIDVDAPVLHNDICAVLHNSAFHVKRFYRNNFSVYLKSDNEAYDPIKIAEEDDLHILGKAVSLMREF